MNDDNALQTIMQITDWHILAFRKAYAETNNIGLSLQLANGLISAIVHKPEEIDQMDGLDMNYEMTGFKV